MLRPPARRVVTDLPLLRFTLDDGRAVGLRPLRSTDRARLAEGFERLSELSRRLRFIGPMSHLSEDQLDYLTTVDGQDHVAWGALDLSDSQQAGLGVARFIRLPDDPEIAEVSFVVLDAVQGLGLGRLLLAVLCATAPSVGVATLRAVVGSENERASTWLQRLGAVVVARGTETVFDLPVASPSAPSAPSSSAFYALVDEVRPLVTRYVQNEA